MNIQHVSRRQFINNTLVTAAAAGATWFDIPEILAASGKKAALNKYGGFPMGIQSYSLRGFGVDGAIEQTHKLGLHFIEFFSGHFPITKDKIKIDEMTNKLDKRDMTISAHGVNGFGADHDKNEVVFQFAKMAGIKNISANPAANSFDSLDKLVAKYDIRISIHNHGPDALYDKIDEMNKKLANYDMTISAHGVNGFGADHDKNEVVFQFAKMAGIKNISANPKPNSFDSLDKLVAKYDIRIAIHNHGPSALYDKIDDGLKAVKGHDKRIGFCADLGHYIRSSEDPVEVIHKLGDRLYGIHLKDFAEQKKKTHGVILGKGHLDVPGVFKALRKVKFPADGALSLEYEESPNDHPKLLADIRECFAIAAEGAQKAKRG